MLHENPYLKRDLISSQETRSLAAKRKSRKKKFAKAARDYRASISCVVSKGDILLPIQIPSLWKPAGKAGSLTVIVLFIIEVNGQRTVCGTDIYLSTQIVCGFAVNYTLNDSRIQYVGRCVERYNPWGRMI
ncbi:MAG TPA: hypothetical protein VFI73_04700 [Candidatus Nitrosopolaris sp.]|nr:hypothetical protein [Candidatus Nitrosopolaris sp.]